MGDDNPGAFDGPIPLRIGELLVRRGILTHDQADRAASLSSERGIVFGEAAVALGFLSASEIDAAMRSRLTPTGGNIIDHLPPATCLSLSPDYQAIASATGAALVVTMEARTRIAATIKMINVCEDLGIKVVGGTMVANAR